MSYMIWIASLVLAMLSATPAFAQCAGMMVGSNVDASTRTGNEAEAAIAIDPTNTQRLFAFSNLGSGSGLFGAYSTNGGANWTKRTMATGADGLAAACCDPSSSWDNFGNLFICYINSSVSAVIVGLSTNGGQTFSQLTSFSGSVDQPTIITGPSNVGGNGAVWVCYNLSGSMVARGATVSGLGSVGAFTSALTIPSASGSFGDIAVGPSGQVMLTYQSPTGGQGPATIYCNTDPDGFGGSAFGARVTITSTNVGGFDFIPAQSGRSIDAEAGLAWDRTGGPHNGRVYLVYTDETVAESNNTEIWVRFSDNNGSTWSSPVRVNDDATTRSQFNPRIVIDQTTGIIALAWMDCRNSAGNNTAQNWGTISTDYGATFLANVQVSTGTSNASTAGSGVDYGDYNGLTGHGGFFHPIWADNSGSLPGYVGSPAFDLGTARVTINLGPKTPTDPLATPSSICEGDSSSLSATVGSGETVEWRTGSCNGAIVGTANPLVVTPASTTTYYARAKNTTTNCLSTNCATVTVFVADPITVNPSSLSNATVAQPYSQDLSASGVTGPYTFAVTSGTLPAGLTLSSGTISGTPTGPAGPANFTITATDTATNCTGSQSYTLIVVCPSVSLAPASLPTALVNRSYNQTITASGANGPYSFAVTAGSLPPGLFLSPGGSLTGAPTITGTFNFTVTATDTSGCTGSKAYSIFVRRRLIDPI